MVKVIISYDMRAGKEQECQEYLSNKVAPLLAQQGFNLNDIWYTMWGDSPQILGGGTVDSLGAAREIFLSDQWQEVEENLESMTYNFQVRVSQVDDA